MSPPRRVARSPRASSRPRRWKRGVLRRRRARGRGGGVTAHEAFDALAPDALATCRSLSSLRLSRNGLRALPSLRLGVHDRDAGAVAPAPRVHARARRDAAPARARPERQRHPRDRTRPMPAPDACASSPTASRAWTLGELRELWLQDNDAPTRPGRARLVREPPRRSRETPSAASATRRRRSRRSRPRGGVLRGRALRPGAVRERAGVRRRCSRASRASSFSTRRAWELSRKEALSRGGARGRRRGGGGGGRDAVPVARVGRGASRGAVDRGEAVRAFSSSTRRASCALWRGNQPRIGERGADARVRLRAADAAARSRGGCCGGGGGGRARRADVSGSSWTTSRRVRAGHGGDGRKARAGGGAGGGGGGGRRRAAFRADAVAYARVEGAASLSAESTSTARPSARGRGVRRPACSSRSGRPEAIALAREAARGGRRGESPRGGGGAVVAAAAGATLGERIRRGRT